MGKERGDEAEYEDFKRERQREREALGPVIQPGTPLYNRNPIGDVSPTTGRSVTVQPNVYGTFDGFFERDDGNACISYMARIQVPDSPGQKTLTCRRNELFNFWSLTPVQRGPMISPGAWRFVMENETLWA